MTMINRVLGLALSLAITLSPALSQTTIQVKDAAGTTQTIRVPNSNGRAAAASSAPIVLSTEDKASIDAPQANAGSDASKAISVQGVTSGKPVPVSGTVTLGAGEAHAGEVGGNQTTVTVAQTVTASSAYASGNAIGGLMTIANAARVSGSSGAAGTSGLLQSTLSYVKSAQVGQVDVVVFSSNPSSSTCTDKTAISIASADFDKIIGVVHITDWTGLGTPSVGQGQNLAMPYALVSSTSLFACAVARSTPTYASTSDVSFSFRFIRN